MIEGILWSFNLKSEMISNSAVTSPKLILGKNGFFAARIAMRKLHVNVPFISNYFDDLNNDSGNLLLMRDFNINQKKFFKCFKIYHLKNL